MTSVSADLIASFISVVTSGRSRISQMGVPTPEHGENLLFVKIFAKNCMKIEEIGWTGGAHP